MTAETNPATAVELRGIVKRFPGVCALNHVDFRLRRGEVHVLLGENGAGKSTLVKILSGVHQPDAGEILVGGLPKRFRTPSDAQRAGISTVYQELNLVPTMDAAKNIFIGRTSTGSVLGNINWKEMYDKSKSLLSTLGMNFDLRIPVSRLSIGQQQMVEIAKALALGVKVLIMDEPTSSLTIEDTERLFSIIERLKRDGVSVIYISHRLEEIKRIGDRITVMRDARVVRSVGQGETAISELVELMIGRNVKEQYPKQAVSIGPEVLRVDNLSRRKTIDGVQLKLHQGEIVGITGLVGAGKSEVLRAIFGADRKDSGEIHLKRRPVVINSPRDAVKHGLGFISEDRKSLALVPEMTVQQNIALASAGRTSTFGIINRRRRNAVAAEYIKRLKIKTPSVRTPIKLLSGGNQQKAVLAKWMCTSSGVLLLDEPTRGIDVGGKLEIYRTLTDLARQGVGILMVSSDLPEILGMCDRIIVMYEGRIAAELSREEATEETVIRYATGQGEKNAN